MLQKLKNYHLTNSMEQSPSCKLNRCSTGQEIPRRLWSPNVHYHVHKSAPLDIILNKVNPVHTATLYSSEIYFKISYHVRSRDSSVGIALGYELDDRCSRVRLPARVGDFSLHHRAQNSSKAYPASYPMGTRGFFPVGKAAGT
jgi:hypothetical protein